MNIQKSILTIEQAAEIVGLTMQTVYWHIRTLTLPATKVGNAWLIDRKDLQDFINKRESGELDARKK